MGKDLGKYHRFKYLGSGETILFEPKPKHFVWMSMYIPPDKRGWNFAEQIFTHVAAHLLGIHHIHCSKRVSTFRQLSIDYQWEYRGRSKYFAGCSYFRFTSNRKPIKKSRNFQISHEVLKRRPIMGTIFSKAHAKDIIEWIKQDYEISM